MAETLEQSAEQLLLYMDRLRKLGPHTAPPIKAKISVSQLGFISFLASNPGAGIQAMASGLKLSKASVSIGVNQLEEAGFVERQSDPQDGRAVLLFLTPKGQQLHQRTFTFRCNKFEHLLNPLNFEERTTLSTLLEKIVVTAEQQENGAKE